MPPRLLPLLLLLALVVAGCQPWKTGPVVNPAPVGGKFFLYLHALAPATSRLRFTIGAVAAVAADGSRWPLALRLQKITLEKVDRQRLLAVGRLPAGSYQGLAVTIQGAWLQTRDGEMALLAPKEPVKVASGFTITEHGAALLEMAYHHGSSLSHRVLFTPDFTAYVPNAPLPSRTGYASCPGGGYLAIFDRDSLQVTGMVAVDQGPAGVVIDQGRQRAYVAVHGGDQVQVLDLRSGELLDRVLLQTGDQPGWLALSPDGRLLLVADTGASAVSLIDTDSLVETDRLPVGEDPCYLLVGPRGQRAYVFNRLSASVSVLDLSQKTVLTTVQTENAPFQGAFSRDGSKLYVLCHGSPYLSVLDTQSLTITSRLAVGLGGSAILVDSDTGLIYLGREGESQVDIYDPNSLLPIDFLEAVSPVDMVIDDERNRLLLAGPTTAGVLAVGLTSRQPAGFIETGAPVRILAIAGARH